MKKKLIMYVYNDITTDARVQRAAEALANDFDLTLISINQGKEVKDVNYRNILVDCHCSGLIGILECVFAAICAIKRIQPNIIYCHDYYSALLAYYLLKTNYPAKIIYDAHELIIPEKGIKDRRQGFFRWFEKRVVKKIDLLICASTQRSEIMKEYYGLKNLPFVVPNISQLQINDEDPETRAILNGLSSFFGHKEKTVVYAGVVSLSRCIGELLEAAISNANNCKLLIVGNGDALESLKEKASQHPELLCTFTGSIPYKCLGSVLSRCDIGFLYYPIDTLNNKYCASNKIFEYASVGLPMIANANPTIKQILDEAHIGLSTNDLNNGLQQITKRSVFYKENCQVFTQKNQWRIEADKLVGKIAAL